VAELNRPAPDWSPGELTWQTRKVSSWAILNLNASSWAAALVRGIDRKGADMRRHVLGIVGVWVIAGAAVLTADFWMEKPFLEWSDKDVEKMMTGSPWAATVGVALPPPPPRPTDDAGGGRGGGRGGGDGFGADPRRVRVTVTWRSALPMKQAVVRSAAGQGGTVTDAQKTFLSQDENFYVLALGGLPPPYSMIGPSTEISAVLERKDKDDILAVDRTSQRGAAGAILLLAFPRGAITLEDREVELVVKIDRLSLKRKFKLQDMVFDGQLEL
jgi:hypothetical protein